MFFIEGDSNMLVIIGWRVVLNINPTKSGHLGWWLTDLVSLQCIRYVQQEIK